MSGIREAMMKRMKHGESSPLRDVATTVEENENDRVSIQELAQRFEEPRQKTKEDADSGLEPDTYKDPQHERGDQAIRDEYNTFKTSFFPFSEVYSNGIKTYFLPPADKTSTILVCLHGAGSSSLTYGRFAQEVRNSEQSLGIFAYDIRGHGDSSQQVLDYTLDELVKELKLVLDEFCSKHDVAENGLYFVGHSLGGSIMAKYLQSQPHHNVKAFIMLDIVEETAVRSLAAMPSFIRNRPKKFDCLSEAINWHMNFLLYNESSAELSIPDLLHPNHTWKTDLSATQPYWNTWFVNLTDNFLAFKGPKLLILSTHETLDKNLIIGQMQGKYQLVVFNNNNKAGHFIHEDLPKQIAICILDFVQRNETPSEYIKNQLGIVPKWGGKINK